MKNTILGAVVLLCSPGLQAQYFYNDILGSAQTERMMKTYREQKVRQVSAAGFDENNVQATDFVEFHEVKEGGQALRITNRSRGDHSVTTHRFDAGGRLESTTDSSALQVSTLRYSYAGGRIHRLENTTLDATGDYRIVETHTWSFDGEGRPTKMIRVLSGNDYPRPDTLEIRFVPDDEGNTGDEVTYRGTRETGRIYYYYDDRGRVTDIVRFNEKLQRLMPDVMFEYDENDRVIQKITTTSDRTVAYLIWRFLFDARGLKTKEAVFDNNKQLKGKIEYSYLFGG